MVCLCARQKQFAGHAQLAAPGKQRRLHKWPEPRRREQEEAFGQRFELAAMNDINFLISGLGGNQARGKTEALTQAQRPGLFANE